MFRDLVADGHTTFAFLNEDITSNNGLLLRNLVQRLDTDHGLVPDPYISLIADLGKYTSVCGLLQVTQARSLQLLEVNYEETQIFLLH